jgi:hypothetical protein
MHACCYYLPFVLFIFLLIVASFLVVFPTQTITEAQMAALMPRLLPPAWRGKALVPWRPLAPASGIVSFWIRLGGF